MVAFSKHIMEEWRTIEKYPRYQVSNLGRVKSFYWDKVNGKIKKQVLNVGGYPAISVQIKGRICRLLPVHRFVAKAFIPNPENKAEVNHISCDKADNRVENLEWVTRTENIRHAFANGLYNPKRGATLTDEQVLEVREYKALGTRALSERYKVKQ
jgi:hypothetical protein